MDEIYWISSYGRVLSRATPNHQRPKIRLLSPGVARSGHLHVSLYRNRARRQAMVHRLVLETFVGPCPEGLQCAHLNGDPQDNRLENLQWVTVLENCWHKDAHGTMRWGETAARVKLTAGDVQEIRHRISTGEDLAAIAGMFSIGRQAVYDIKVGKTWKRLSK